jgi:hypothetical protein
VPDGVFSRITPDLQRHELICLPSSEDGALVVQIATSSISGDCISDVVTEAATATLATTPSIPGNSDSNTSRNANKRRMSPGTSTSVEDNLLKKKRDTVPHELVESSVTNTLESMGSDFPSNTDLPESETRDEMSRSSVDSESSDDTCYESVKGQGSGTYSGNDSDYDDVDFE